MAINEHPIRPGDTSQILAEIRQRAESHPPGSEARYVYTILARLIATNAIVQQHEESTRQGLNLILKHPIGGVFTGE
jgi:hypothetical protein